MTSRALIDAWTRSAPLSAPAAVLDAARLHFLDAIGVGLAASAMPAQGAPYQRYAAHAPAGSCSSLASAKTLTAVDAALVNGGLIHSLEFDDTHTQSIVHGSSVLASTALAAGQEAGSSGSEILAAYMRGWDALIRVGLAAPGGFQSRGYQVTSVGGALIAAMIASDLMKLDASQSINAVGISLSQASGVFEFLSNGSSVKSLHPGWAAHAGITAARLAACGMTGPATALEGRHGLFAGFAGDFAAAQRFEHMLADFGTVWMLTDAAFKLVPCCHYLHAFVEAGLALREQGIRADDIAEIIVRIAPGAASIVCEPWAVKCAPADGHAARWSLPIVVAEALVHGRVDLETFSRPADAAVRELAHRSRMEPLQHNDFPRRFEAEVTCAMRDGSTRHIHVDDALGNASRPANRDVIIGKFRDNASRALTDSAVAQAESTLFAIDHPEALDQLAAALLARRPTEHGL